MFLQMLNKKEKENFLELAYYVMNVDGKEDPTEINMFNNFRAEMFLSEDVYKIKKKKVDTLITEFKNSTKKKQRVVLLELLGIALSDNEYHEKEEELVTRIKNEWNIREYEVKKSKRWVEDFMDMISEAMIFIEGRE